MFKSYGSFTVPSFLKGSGMAIDLGSTMTRYNFSDSPEEADLNALKSDWKVIGRDISLAIIKYEDEYAGKLQKHR